MKNSVFLDFKIVGFEDITHNELTNLIGLQPTKIQVKGEKVNPMVNKLFVSNVWILGSSCPAEISFSDQMNALLDILEPKIAVLKCICQKYYCEFSCVLYLNQGENTPWVHFDRRYNDFNKELNIEFDLDLYV